MDPSTLSIEERLSRLEVGMKEIQTGIAELKAEREQQTEWMKRYAMSMDWQTLGPLRADLVLAFAERAMALLSKTDPSLAPEAIKDDRDRIPMLAAVVAGIPEEVYAGWGMRGYREMMRRQFTAFVSVKPSRSVRCDRYDFAKLMMHSHWTEEKRVLKPLFMFVYGKSFEEMHAERPPSGLLGIRCDMVERKPWVPEDAKKSWRKPVRRGRRSGGRNGRSGG